MIRLAISVEGQTEEKFVKSLLAAHLHNFDIYATAIVIETSRTASGRKFKGGSVSTKTVKKELDSIIKNYPDGFVTSLYDFYGFQDRIEDETVENLENRIAELVGRPKNFIPYVQIHEFEGLLLADSDVVGEYFQADRIRKLTAEAVAKAGSPEAVNDGPNTAPSKRLESWTLRHAPRLLRYTKDTKPNHAPRIAERLTLPVIRAACPRFDGWLGQIERLGR